MNSSEIISTCRKGYTSLCVLAFITDICNKSCWYCYNKIPDQYKELDLSVFNAYIEFLKTKRSDIDIELIGGEPSCHSKIVEFCKNCKAANMSMYTNFSKELPLYEQLANNGMKFDITYHTGNSTTLDNIYAIDVNSIIGITVMLDPTTFDNDIGVYTELKKSFPKLDVDVQLVFIKDQVCDKYTADQLKIYDNLLLNDDSAFFEVKYKNTSELVTHNKLYELTKQHFKYWKCNAGKDLLYVHSNGNVYNCDGYFNARKPPLFNLYAGFKYINKATFCQVENCPFEDNVYKERIFK